MDPSSYVKAEINAGLTLLQSPSGLKFGTDALLLAAFGKIDFDGIHTIRSFVISIYYYIIKIQETQEKNTGAPHGSFEF